MQFSSHIYHSRIIRPLSIDSPTPKFLQFYHNPIRQCQCFDTSPVHSRCQKISPSYHKSTIINSLLSFSDFYDLPIIDYAPVHQIISYRIQLIKKRNCSLTMLHPCPPCPGPPRPSLVPAPLPWPDPKRLFQPVHIQDDRSYLAHGHMIRLESASAGIFYHTEYSIGNHDCSHQQSKRPSIQDKVRRTSAGDHGLCQDNMAKANTPIKIMANLGMTLTWTRQPLPSITTTEHQNNYWRLFVDCSDLLVMESILEQSNYQEGLKNNTLVKTCRNIWLTLHTLTVVNVCNANRFFHTNRPCRLPW